MSVDLRTWDAWHKVHQPFELDWWKKAVAEGHSTDDVAFRRFWDEIDEFIQPKGRVIDIGCGPRPPFQPGGAIIHSTVIEPLAEEYQFLDGVKSEWWERIHVHAVPAEKRLQGLLTRGDTVVCWNCIDHAIGWREILDNMVAYCAPEGRVAIATDFWPPFDGHPGFDRAEFEREIAARFVIERVKTGDPEHGVWRTFSFVARVKT